MDLQKAADEAMAYLDSVGVAADWGSYSYHGIGTSVLIAQTDKGDFYQSKLPIFSSDIMEDIKDAHPQKSPA